VINNLRTEVYFTFGTKREPKDAENILVTAVVTQRLSQPYNRSNREKDDCLVCI